MPTLTLKNVRKSFGGNDVLRGIDLEVTTGQMICLIGASGSGKSTLLRCLNLLEPIDDGTITLDGTDISEPGFNPQPVRQRIGMVFQSYNLFPHMTAMDNAMLAPRRIHGHSRAELEPRLADLFTRFGLGDRMQHYPDQLSGGQQQRVAIVRALAMRPEIMLFDEITSALDPELVGEVLGLVRQLAEEGSTILMATHEMAFARDVAHRVLFLDEGRVLEEGTPAQVFGAPREDRTREFLARFRA